MGGHHSTVGLVAAKMGIVRGHLSPAEAAHVSRTSLDRPLAAGAELLVAEVRGAATVRGAFQRGGGVRRGSGGPEVLADTGTVWVALALARSGELTPCPAARLVNRYVRPLLRAIGKLGAPAHYFGRDWVSVQHRPAAFVGFAHDASSGRALFEAIVAVSAPFAPSPRPSFLGKEPGTLAGLLGRPVEASRLVDVIVESYADAYGLEALDATPVLDPRAHEVNAADPPWAACRDEAIGPVCAGPDRNGVLRVGGDLMASRDAIAALEARLAALPSPADRDAIARAVDATFTAPGVVLDGVRSLQSIAEVIERARSS
jgi:hypothetical protein